MFPRHDEADNAPIRFAQLIILTAERAWAHAMHMKSMRATDSTNTAIRGPTRTHIVSRLVKAEKLAGELVGSFKGQVEETVLEAQAYRLFLQGGASFESQKWVKCIKIHSDLHVIYTALSNSRGTNQKDPYQEVLSSTVEPSIRYAAYQLRIPRTLSIPSIVEKNVTKDSNYVETALRICPGALGTKPAESDENTADSSSLDIPKTISWKSRNVKLEDANIAQALALVKTAERKLSDLLESNTEASSRDKVTAYEQVLTPSQDAVDATKTAIDELTAEGVGQGDPRIQSLQITRTAVNYELIGWRIGRNRTLCGRDDGAYLDPLPSRKLKRRRGKDSEMKEEPEPIKSQQESNGHKLVRLRERVVLYDSTLQSLDSIKELPGAAADSALLQEVASEKAYFSALRCLAIARSHSIQRNYKNTLALLDRASGHASSIEPVDSDTSASGKPLRHHVTQAQSSSLQSLLRGMTTQYHALVELESMAAEDMATEKVKAEWLPPMIERLDEYPMGGVDLTNLVNYPPRLRPVPVKPIFLDIAWNYIQYPGKEKAAAENAQGKVEQKNEAPAKKGWGLFGLGRS